MVWQRFLRAMPGGLPGRIKRPEGETGGREAVWGKSFGTVARSLKTSRRMEKSGRSVVGGAADNFAGSEQDTSLFDVACHVGI